VVETYPTVESAIGQVEGRATIIDKVPTENPCLRSQGFTETWYVDDAQGTQWTVARNPSTGEFTGAHPSRRTTEAEANRARLGDMTNAPESDAA